MSLQVMDPKKDQVHTRTELFRPKQREFSHNLNTKDVQGRFFYLKLLGAQPKIFAPKVVNRAEFQNVNDDIEGAAPRVLHFPLNKPYYNLTNYDI